MRVTKTSKTCDNEQNLFFYYQGYYSHTIFNISLYKFHLLWSAEMPKPQIITFPSLAYYIRAFLKQMWRGHHGMVTHVFSNIQVPKIFEKRIMQNNLFSTFLKCQHLRRNN